MPIDPRRDVARLQFRTLFTASLEVSRTLRVVIGAKLERAGKSRSRKQQRRLGGDAYARAMWLVPYQPRPRP